MDGGGDHPIRREPLHQQTERRDVGDGVERADLMKMDLSHRTAVHAALRLGDQPINLKRV